MGVKSRYRQHMLDDLPLDEARKDPDKFIPQVEEKHESLKAAARGVSAILKELRRIKESHEQLEHIRTQGVPRPRESSRKRSGASDSEQESSVGGEGVSRREQVCRLLVQQPMRSWKVKDIAEALHIDNVKSLRTSLDDFVRSGVISKNVENSSYFVDMRGYQRPF
jgi:hypothetical protein